MKEIPIDHFLNYKYLSNLKANNEKNKLSLLRAVASYDKNKYTYELHEYRGKITKKYSFPEKPIYLYEEDDTLLLTLYKTKEDKEKQKEKYTIYYRHNIKTKANSIAYTFSFPTQIVEILNSNKLLLKASLTKEELGLITLFGEERKALLKELEQAKNFEEIEELPYYFNGEGFINNKRTYLIIYNIKEETYTFVNEKNQINIHSYKLDEAKENIYFIGSIKETKAKLTKQIYLYNIKNNNLVSLYDKDDFQIDALYLVKNELICYATDGQKIGINQNRFFYKVKNNELILWYELKTSLGNSISSDVTLGSSDLVINYKDGLLFTTTVVDHSELYYLDNNELKQIFISEGSINAISEANNFIYLIMQNKQKLQELYRLDLDNKKLKQISSFNDKVLKGYYVAKAKEVVYKGKEHEVKGYVLLPKDYDKTKKYPAILDIHGGPKTVYGKVFFHEMQVWANMGYLVMFANPRGSDGKGDAFSDIRGKYGTIDYFDLMKFTDKVLKKYPAIDENNLFVTGGSYGGFMTNWIVGHTNRFKAAVTQRSISNWLSFYPTADIGYYFGKDQVAGHPLTDRGKLWEQSPLKYSDNVKTPLLFIHSDKDYRCPIEQAMQFYGILKDRGHKTKLIWFKDENHDLSRAGKPQARLKRLREITNWFNEHLDR